MPRLLKNSFGYLLLEPECYFGVFICIYSSVESAAKIMWRGFLCSSTGGYVERAVCLKDA